VEAGGMRVGKENCMGDYHCIYMCERRGRKNRVHQLTKHNNMPVRGCACTCIPMVDCGIHFWAPTHVHAHPRSGMLLCL